jgi:hypothetical protein
VLERSAAGETMEQGRELCGGCLKIKLEEKPKWLSVGGSGSISQSGLRPHCQEAGGVRLAAL